MIAYYSHHLPYTPGATPSGEEICRPNQPCIRLWTRQVGYSAHSGDSLVLCISKCPYVPPQAGGCAL